MGKSNLYIPLLFIQEALLDVFFSALRIEVPEWYQPLLDVPNIKRKLMDMHPRSLLSVH